MEGNSNGRIDTNALERHCEHFTACLSVVCATDPKWVSWNGLRLGLPSAMGYRFGVTKVFGLADFHKNEEANEMQLFVHDELTKATLSCWPFVSEEEAVGW